MQIEWATECRDKLESDLAGNVFIQFEIREVEELGLRKETRNTGLGRSQQNKTLDAIISDLICNLHRQSQQQKEGESLEVTWDRCPYPLGPDAEPEAGGEDPRYVIQVLERLGYVQCNWPAGSNKQRVYCSLTKGPQFIWLAEQLTRDSDWLQIDPNEIGYGSSSLESSNEQGSREPKGESGEEEAPERDPGRPGYPFYGALKMELRRRGEAGELFDTLAAEMRRLQEWAEQRYPEHTLPTKKTLKNKFRDLYKQLRQNAQN